MSFRLFQNPIHQRGAIVAGLVAVAFTALALPNMSSTTKFGPKTEYPCVRPDADRLVACTEAYLHHVRQDHRSIAAQLKDPLDSMMYAVNDYKALGNYAALQRDIREAAQEIIVMRAEQNGHTLDVGIVEFFPHTLIAIASASRMSKTTGMPQVD